MERERCSVSALIRGAQRRVGGCGILRRLGSRVDVGESRSKSAGAVVVTGDEPGSTPLLRPPWPAPTTDPRPPDAALTAAAPSRRPSRMGWAIAVAVVVLAALVVGTIVVVNVRDGAGHPSSWDPRVADLARFVERDKGTDFEHPVTVTYLDESGFKDRLRMDGATSDEDRQDIDDAEAMLRALGLQGGEGSLFDQANTLNTEGVAAFYDPDTKAIVIPEGDAHSLSMQATLVHELTHALQDQLGQLEDDGGDSEAAAGRQALIEGEAEHVKEAWIDGLDDEERAQLDEEDAATGEEVTSELMEVNTAMLSLFAVPYSLGAPMVDAIDAAGRVEDAFDDPPNSSADVLDPTRWLDPLDVIPVDDPVLADGEEAIGEADALGAYTLYLVLATALEPAGALAAADGWGGDRMQAYRNADGATCVRVDIVGIDEEASTRVGEALDTWAASRSDDAASSNRTDGQIRLDACDDDSDGEPLSADAAGVPSLRASLVPVLLDSGASAALATCISVDLVEAVSYDLLIADDLPASDEQRVSDAMDAAASDCGAG
jgi:hypothetical protein